MALRLLAIVVVGSWIGWNAPEAQADDHTEAPAVASDSAEEESEEEKSAEDESAEDESAEEEAAAEKPADDPAVEETPVKDKSAEEKPADAAAGEEKPAEDDSAEKAPAEKAPAEKAPAEKAPAEKAPAVNKAGPAAMAFDETFTRWKELLKTLRDIRSQYTIAEEDQLDNLREQWKSRIADGETLKSELDATALAAYAEAPNEDRELLRYLLTVASDQIRADEYADAKQLLETMVESGCDENALPDLAGIAAFCSNDFDAAKKYFDQADENNSLSRQSMNYRGDVESCQEKWAAELKLREAEAAADDLPRVKLETTAGDIVIELFENEAPETVGNFVSLIEKGFYDGLTFHRVLEAFMAQGGCPNGNGQGGPGYDIFCECVNDNHRQHFAGSLSMAKGAAVNSGGSQFFITFVPTSSLDGKHTVFGRVMEGFDNAIHIQRINPDDPDSAKVQPTKIIKATVVRKRDHEYRPNKVAK